MYYPFSHSKFSLKNSFSHFFWKHILLNPLHYFYFGYIKKKTLIIIVFTGKFHEINIIYFIFPRIWMQFIALKKFVLIETKISMKIMKQYSQFEWISEHKNYLEYLKDYYCNLNVNTSSRVEYPFNSVLSYNKLSPSYKSFVMSISSHVEPNTLKLWNMTLRERLYNVRYVLWSQIKHRRLFFFPRTKLS